MTTPPRAPETVRLAHGAGGAAMRALIEDVFLRDVADAEARAMDDGAAIRIAGAHGDRWLVITTDAHVVQPVFFPGGDIGRLAVCGTVNDLAMMGATEVLALTVTVIVEEGYAIDDLHRVARSMRAACAEAGARLVAGDTKVMRRGELDGLALSSSGVALADRVVRSAGVRAGDAVLCTGTIGDHGLAVLGARHQLGLGDALRSDVAPLNDLVRVALAAGGDAVHAMKDPTRGGVTSALFELARASGVAMRIDDAALPYTDATRAAAELLGIDPLVVANEGKALLAVAPEAASRVLDALRAHPLGARAAIIGHAAPGEPGDVLLDTGFGARRLRERDGDPLPRIC